MIQPTFGNDLAFSGYRSFEAAPEDHIRSKWHAVRNWLSLPSSVAPVRPDLAAITERNELINSVIRYTPEPDGADVWQTPAQTMLLKRGDCEDYAILKYALMRQAELRALVVVGEIKSALKENPKHAWCAAFVDGVWRVLDNKFDQIITPAEYLNFIPLAAMHDDNVVRFGREFSIADALTART